MANAIVGAELVVLEGAGHTSMIERHAEFNDALRRFVVRVGAAAQARG
jgi:pimeloyl-ACP methyl ester carboxylesterase